MIFVMNHEPTRKETSLFRLEYARNKKTKMVEADGWKSTLGG